MSCNLAAHAAMRAMTHPDTDLNQTDRCVFAWLVYRANGIHKCYKTVEDIQRGLNIGTRQTVSAATRKLREKGLIEVKRRFHDSNHYEILDPDGYLYGDWSAPHVKDSDHVSGAGDVRENDHLYVKETDFPQAAHVKDSDHVVDSTCQEILPTDVKETDLSPATDVKRIDQEVQVSQVSTQDKNPRVHASVRSRAYAEPPGFNAFYAAYPRKKSRADAAKAFVQQLNAGHTPQEILAGLSRHRFNPDPRFIPYPASWLRDKAWLDEPDPEPCSEKSSFDKIRDDGGFSSLLTPRLDDVPSLLLEAAP